MTTLAEAPVRHESSGVAASAGEPSVGRAAVTGAIVGARKPGQLKELVGAAEWTLTDGEAGEIEAFLKANPV